MVLGRPFSLFICIKIHSQAPALDTQKQNFQKLSTMRTKFLLYLSELPKLLSIALLALVVVTLFKGGGDGSECLWWHFGFFGWESEKGSVIILN
jgi:NhaP-type Na+/H+ or K+/H+ antiporter